MIFEIHFSILRYTPKRTVVHSQKRKRGDFIEDFIETEQIQTEQTVSEVKLEDLCFQFSIYNAAGDMIQSVWSAAPMYLDKRISDNDCISTFTSTGVDSMNYRISRKVTINGAVHWIYANTEQQYCDKIITISQQHQQPETPKQKHNFQDYAVNWFETYSRPNIEKVTANTYQRQLDKYLIPWLGEYDIEDITTDNVQQLFNSMNCKKATKEKVKIVLNQIFVSAMEDNYITKNPLKSSKLKITGGKSRETPPYTVEEMQYIIRHLDDIKKPEDRLYIVIQALHPLRLEEVLGLRWTDVDFQNNLLHINRAVTHPNRNQPLIKDTKTDGSRRSVGLSALAAEYLSQAFQPDGFIFGGDKPLSYTQSRRMCEHIQKDIGFDGKITPIRFRTTVLTDIYEQTKDIKLTQQAAGHTTATMTLKHYVKGRESSADSAKAIDDLYTA